MFYIAQHAVCLTAQSASPPGRHVHSATNATYLESIQSRCELLHEDCSHIMSTATYGQFVFYTKLGRRGENENTRASKQQQSGFEPGSLVQDCDILHNQTLFKQKNKCMI